MLHSITALVGIIPYIDFIVVQWYNLEEMFIKKI